MRKYSMEVGMCDLSSIFYRFFVRLITRIVCEIFNKKNKETL